MSLDRNRPRPRRRLVILGSSALLAVAGLGGFVALQGKGATALARAATAPASSAQLRAASVATVPQKADASDPAETPTAPDTDTLQSGSQGAAATTAPGSTAEAASPETAADGPGGWADTVANAQTDQQGEH